LELWFQPDGTMQDAVEVGSSQAGSPAGGRHE